MRRHVTWSVFLHLSSVLLFHPEGTSNWHSTQTVFNKNTFIVFSLLKNQDIRKHKQKEHENKH